MATGVLRQGPLNAAYYQRHGEGKWVLVRKGMGFA